MPGLVDGVFMGFDYHVGSLFTQAFLGSRGWGHDEAYSAAGKTWFGWWLVEHYFSYHVNCPDSCGSGEPARGG